MSNGNGQRLFRYYGNQLSIQQAGASTDGYLSSADWNRFNNPPVFSVFGRQGDVVALAGDYAQFYQPLGSYEVPLDFEMSLYRNGNVVTLRNDMPVDAPTGAQMYYGMTPLGVRGWFDFGAMGVSSWNTRTGAVMPQAGDYTAAQVTNAVSTLGSYANPAWITSLAWGKITGAPPAVASFNTRTGAVMPQAGDYTAAQVGAEVPLTFVQSVYRNGNQISLLGDVPVASVTALQYYGTNAAGNRGWYNLPVAGVSSVFTRTGAITAQAGDYAAFYEPSLGNPSTNGYILSSTAAGVRSWIAAPASGVTSFNTRTGAVMPASGDYTATQVGAEPSLGNPSANGYILSSTTAGARSWIAPPSAPVTSVFTRTGAITAVAGDYAAFYPQLTGSYANPTWITSLAWAKVTGPINVIDNAFTIASHVTPANTIQFVLSGLTAPRTITPADGSSITVLPGIAPTTGPSQQQYMTGINSNGTINYQNIPFSDITGQASVAQGGVPVGGLTNQILAKNSNANYDLKWGTAAGLPVGGAAGFVLTKNSATDYDASWAAPPGGGGGGTVMSFSAGNLSPLFTTSVATATSTPALSFILSNAGAHQFLGNNTGATAVPTYVQPAFTDISGVATTAQLPATVVLTSGSYSNPAWITALAWTKITGTPTSISGYGIVPVVGDYSAFYVSLTGSYADPAWITSLAWAKITGAPASEPPLGNPTTSGYILSSTTTGTRSWIAPPSAPVSSVFTRTGAVVGQAADYSAFYPQLTGTYSNPAWITALGWAKISGTPTTLSGYGITDPVVLTSGSYADPAWITALAWAKISGKPTTLAGYGITDPIVLTTGSYGDPAWITSLGWSKITGAPAFITGNQTITLTGDVTGSGATSIATSLVQIRNATPVLGYLNFNATPAPTGPASGNGFVWIDNIDKRFHDRNDAGVLGTTVVPATAGAGQAINSISASGVLGFASFEPPLGNPTSNGWILSSTSAGVRSWIAPPAGTGTVTNFTAGNCPVLFTTSVGTSTTTPALSFALSNALANSYLGNTTGVAAAPSYIQGGALTETDDTNVTLALGGTPAFSLLRAVSLTLGWTGLLAVARGGTGVNSAPANTFFANTGASAAAPSFVTAAAADLSNGVTGTGAIALAASPTFTGTLNCANLNCTGTMLRPNLIQGTNTNDAAAAGNVGQILTAQVASPGGAMTANTAKNITQITLTAGDWDVRGNVVIVANAIAASGGVEVGKACINTVSATMVTDGTDACGGQSNPTVAAQNLPYSMCLPTQRYSVAANTIVYLVAMSGGSASSRTGYGFIEARRIR